MMKYDEMKEILLKLNAKWNLDFVSATSGDCCNTCTDMYTEEETKQYYNAKTFLVIKWFFAGMNYTGKFEEQQELYIKYSFGENDINGICKDLEEALKEHYTVQVPENEYECIILKKI